MTAFLTYLWLTLLPLSFQTDQFILLDETGQLDAEIIQSAAEPLIEDGAKVAVFVVADGDLDSLLADYYLLNDHQLAPETIAIFINSSDNTTEIRYGSKWRRAVAKNQESIYQDRLAPGVMTGAYNAGIVNALNEISHVVKENNQANASTLPSLSSSMFVIFGVGLVLISFIMWMFTRQQPRQINFS